MFVCVGSSPVLMITADSGIYDDALQMVMLLYVLLPQNMHQMAEFGGCQGKMNRQLLCRLVDGQPVGGPCSRTDKLKAALKLHLPQRSDAATANMQLLSHLLMHIQSTWGIKLDMQQGCGHEATSPSMQHSAAAVPSLDTKAISQQSCEAEQDIANGAEAIAATEASA